MKNVVSFLYFGFLALLFPVFSPSCGKNASHVNPDADVDAGADVPDAAGDADDADVLDCKERIVEDVMIPVGDGARLAATVVRPAGENCRLPVILVQTPYGRQNFIAEFIENPQADHPLFRSPDYAVAVLDWRGFFGSSGAPPASLQRGYGEDGYDVIAWIAQQPWSDGNVGTWGVSALCRVQYQTAVLKPPALLAAVPIFCQNNYTYLETYPGGVIRREYIQFLTAYYGASLWEAHPTRDAWWVYAERLYPVEDIAAPMLVVAGWFDLYNTGGIETFHALRERSAAAVRAQHRLLAGPWHHFASGGESTGIRPLNAQELLYFDAAREIERFSLRFFDHHLRGRTDAIWPDPVLYRRANETGWESADAWPPTQAQEISWVISADGTLHPQGGVAGDIVLPVDPFDPSPTVGGQTLLSTYDHGPAFQDDVVQRADAAVFVSPVLSEPLRLAGPVRVEVEASVNAVDGDVAVRLTDVAPDGRHLLITDGIARLSLPPPYATRTLLVPGTRVRVAVDLTNHTAWTFLPGHRVGLILSGANYARFDVNPHNGNPFSDGVGVPAQLTLHLDASARLTAFYMP